MSEGKTKQIFPIPGSPARVVVKSKDDITAGDGAKHDIIEGKAALSTRTTCNVFRLLRACGIPVAFEDQDGPTEFIADKCTMLSYEVVIRREAHGSYLDRNPHLPKGHVFPNLVLEFFLKTHGKIWINPVTGRSYELQKDDPLMVSDHQKGWIELYYPGHTSEERKIASKGQLVGQKPFLVLSEEEIFFRGDEGSLMARMGNIARQAFLVLEKAWQIQGRRLVDFKVEFGINTEGLLLLADVIDNDSWRLIEPSGGYMDKQVYRDGGDLNTVTAKYREVADLTDRFEIPPQRLIIWCGSDKDHFTAVEDLWLKLEPKPQFQSLPITCSVHKQPALAYKILQHHLQEGPYDSVIIAYIGRSNGAGPVLAANCTVPVITVPAGYKEFPEDVWSSLRTPSNVPVMTVLEPANAVLAALQILAMRNPSIYAALRFEQEKRLVNV